VNQLRLLGNKILMFFWKRQRNVTLDRIVEIAQTGVDVVSVGELTHSVKALDISMYVKVDQVQ